MQTFSIRSRLSALVIMSVVVIGMFIAPTPANAAITCYVGTTRDLYVGVSDGEDVRNLQKVLNNDPDTQIKVPNGNAGSPGFETTHFGIRTKDAVKEFQKKYGVTPAEGYVGTLTRVKLTLLYVCGGGMTAYDYNGDGASDKLDEFFLRDLILENRTCPAGTVCDVNNNKQINVADVLALSSYLDANRPTIIAPTALAPPQFSPASPTSFTLGGPYVFELLPVAGADNYGFEFAQDYNGDGTSVFSEGLNGSPSYDYAPSGRLEIMPGHHFYNSIRVGDLKVRAWAAKGSILSDPAPSPARIVSINSPRATITVVTPTSVQTGSIYRIRWSSPEDGLWEIIIRKGATVIASWSDEDGPVGVTRLGSTTVVNGVSATNYSFDWHVPANLALGNDYKIYVALPDITLTGSSGAFSVVPKPKIQVTSPNSGTEEEEWNIGSITSPKKITWTSTGLVGNSVNITLKRQPGNVVVGSLTPMGTSNDQGDYIHPQNNNTPGFQWRLDNSFLKDPSFQQFGSGYVIEICNITRTVCDESDKPFTILDEIPKITFTSLTLNPPGTQALPYTIGETTVSYSAILSNNGIRSISSLTMATWVEQGGARSAVVELPLACRAQAQGMMTPGSCLSDGASQLLPVRAEIGQFTRGQGSVVLEVKQGANVLATKPVTVQLYPPPSVQVLFPRGPASVDRFALRNPLPPIRWKTEGLIDNIAIKIKQADPVPLYDFNGDGAVNGQDVIILRDFALSGGLSVCNATTAKNCDIDGDGVLTESDAGWLTSNILLADPLRYVDRVEMFDFDRVGSGAGVFNEQDILRLADAIQLSNGSLSDCFNRTGKNCDVNRNGQYGVDDTIYLQTILNTPPPATTLPGASILTNNKDAENTFSWTPNAPFVLPAGNYKIVVCDLARPNVCDESDNTFLIYAGPPTITKPAVNEKFFIQDDMKIEVYATHTLSLSEYKIGLYQNNQLVYENVRDGGSTSTVPFFINNALIRLSDGKRVIDVLKEGPLRIVVSGKLGASKGFTNSAERIVQLAFNRTPPVFQSPTPGEGQEVNLGKFPIPVAATHGAKPRRYELGLFQNGADVFRQTINAQPDGKFVFEFTRATLQQSGLPLSATNRKVFDLLQEGEVKIVLQGQLLDGSFTSPAERFIRVVPVPPNFDLNGDGDIDIEDFKILQLTILEERKCTDPPVTADKNCDLNRDGNVNVADLASMVAHPLYQKPQPAPSLPTVGAPVTVPTVSSPQSGASWSPGSPVVIQEVAGATGYLVGFIRARQLIHENYRDENRSLATTTGAGGTRVYRVSVAAQNKFTAGLMYIYVRALVNNQWTDAAVVPVTVR